MTLHLDEAAERRARYIVFLAPLLNAMNGMAVDLYAPSLPAISAEFGASASQMQNTLTATLAGFAIGQLSFGVIADCLGRLRALWPGLLLFIAASIGGIVASDLAQLTLARALQGFALGCCPVIARALLVDSIRGPRYYTAMVYLSLAWGAGPVLAPYVGSLIDMHLGWRWNFALYAALGVTVALAALPLRETLPPERRLTPPRALLGFATVARDARFVCGALVLGTSFASFLVWNITGPFVVQRLGLPVTAFGQIALGAGAAYLSTTLATRWLLRRYSPDTLMRAGLYSFAVGAALPLLAPSALDPALLLLTIVCVNAGQGLIFSNALARTMPLFPDKAGTAASLLGCINMATGALSAWILSGLSLHSHLHFSLCFAVLATIQALAIGGMNRSIRRARARYPLVPEDAS